MTPLMVSTCERHIGEYLAGIHTPVYFKGQDISAKASFYVRFFVVSSADTLPIGMGETAKKRNVGLLQANIQLFPKASATDGLLDVIVASPTGVADMATMAARLFARLRGEVAHVDEVSGHRIRITVAEPVPYELDGDPEGRARVFEAEVAPGALLLMQHQ